MPTDSLPVTPLFTIECDTGTVPPVLIPDGPHGTRVVATISGGTFTGERLRGVVAPAAAGDWVTLRADGTFKLDVRLTLQTDDGAVILVTYTGVGRRQEDGTASLRTSPLFETGDDRYAWLNAVQAVGIGQTTEGGVRYEVYELL